MSHPSRTVTLAAFAATASVCLFLSLTRNKVPPGSESAHLDAARARTHGQLLASPAFGGARAHAASPRYDDALMNKWGLHRPACTPGLDFLVANTGMSDRWICGTKGELSVVAAMRRVLEPACSQAGPGSSLFLDVGSNSGMYGLMAIAAGCRSIFFDLQPGCNKVVTGALLANGWADRGLVVAAGLSEASGLVSASSTGTCDRGSGRFPVNVLETGRADQGDVRVPTEPLATFIGPDTHILLMKVDTEGFEQRVLAGCMPYFERRLIKHAVVEVTPGHQFWEKRGVEAADVAATFESIVRAGYTMTLLGNVTAVNTGTGKRMTDPVEVRKWVLARRVGQIDVLLSLT